MDRRRKTTIAAGRVSRETVVAGVRHKIIAGGLRPGDRLPPHVKIQREFGAARLTVERAMAQLRDEGFVRGIAPLGTFVADRPPHLSRYALVFDGSPDRQTPWTWSRFYRAMIEASRTLAAERRITFPIYYDVNAHQDSEGYQSLMRDVEAQRLAGILFAFAPRSLQETPLMERSDPPHAGAWEHELPGAVPDVRQFIYRAVDHLMADGRRRFAVVTMPQQAPGFPDEFRAALESRGGITRRFWTQGIVSHHTEWIPHAVRAILRDDPDHPPDALVITDDHLVEPVAAALAEFGVRVPQQMRVVGHWNFPLPYSGQVPIDLLGFDARELLRSWVDAIDVQRRGEQTPSATVPARFAWEVLTVTEPKTDYEPAETTSQKQARGRKTLRTSPAT